MLLSTLAFTFRRGPRVGFSYAGQIDTTNFGRDGLDNGTFTRGESLITSFKNLENDMVLLGKKKNQHQEKYSKTYKNILDDVLADIQGILSRLTIHMFLIIFPYTLDVQGLYIIEKSGQSQMVIVNLANELLPSLPNGTITLPASTNISVKGSLLKKSLAGCSSKQDKIRGGAPKISAREKLLTDKPAAFWNGPSSYCDSGLL
ncbi:hypothetical protein Tco_0948440 [Tanacetum coccineum]